MAQPPDALGHGFGIDDLPPARANDGGRIWVESAPGRGSTFHFTASFSISQAAGSSFPGNGQLKRNAGTGGGRQSDESPHSRMPAGRLGMQPTLAGDGAQALRTLAQASESQQPFSLVLTDASMPGMDGFQLADEIRKNPKLCCTAILMLTSADNAAMRRDAARRSGKAILRNP